jgi:hypothetical protein|tara:strand:+ start:459 stop:842 length:384 start_codon:yes stop_codon:yes gene_type:complete
MAILTTINGIPLYSTSREADEWAKSKGITGVHTHTYRGQTGYMGGIDHASARNPQQEEQFERQQENIERQILEQRNREVEEERIDQIIAPVDLPEQQTTPPPTQQQTTTPYAPPPTSGGSTGGGGGY